MCACAKFFMGMTSNAFGRDIQKGVLCKNDCGIDCCVLASSDASIARARTSRAADALVHLLSVRNAANECPCSDPRLQGPDTIGAGLVESGFW